MTIKYQAICSNCGRVYPVLLTDPSNAPVCSKRKMDTLPQDTDEWTEKTIKELGFYS